MTGRSRSHNSGWLLRLAGLWFAGTLVVTSAAPRASAQSTQDPWEVPLNLSHSGAATNPAVVVDSEAVMHVVWQDAFANYVYARLEGGQWSAPEPTSLHLLFGVPPSQEGTRGTQAPSTIGPNPFFLAGPGPYIFAFWITPEGSLYASRVLNSEFSEVSAWEGTQLLSPSVASLAAAVDARGFLHLAYVRTVDGSVRKAGIYYTRSRNNAGDWSTPAVLDESSYFRGLEGREANLSLATAETAESSLVYVAWDNRPRKQVLLAKSTDGGASWEQPMLVAGPAPASGLAGPFNIRVSATGDRGVVVWQSGEPGGACTQVFEFSGDAGSSWSEAQQMIEDLPGCAEANEFVAGQAANPESLLFLLTTGLQGQAFMSAWNGSQWSEPQVQPVLAGFEHPEIYTQVVFDCHQPIFMGERLYIVGCDQGGGGEVWVASRDLASAASWFLPPVWTQPAPVTGSDLEVASAKLVATSDGMTHAFFGKRQDPAIYYARWDGAKWSRTTSVLQLPEGEADRPAIAAGPGNELFLITRSSNGSLYFSRANSRDAIRASGWSTPARLRTVHDGAVSPADVAWIADGTLYVAYSVPVNDERGVYLIQSTDHGKSWSAPLQVFDGVTADFDLVGSPTLLAAANGFVHLLWNQQSIQGEGVSQTLSLYYARSEDAGQTFSEAELVVEAPVAWREVLADGEGKLHRLWQRPDMVTTLWDQISLDGGRSWQVAQRLPAEEGTATVSVDPVGRLHLIGVGPESLGHWLWDEGRWQAEAPLRWSSASQSEASVESVGAAISTDGKMVVVLAIPRGPDDVAEGILLYSTRMLDLPAIPPAIAEPPKFAPPSPAYTAPATPIPLSPLTQVATSEGGSAPLQDLLDRIRASDPIAPYALAVLPVAFLLLIALGMVLIRAARVKGR